MAKKTAKRNIVTPDPKGVKTGISFEDLKVIPVTTTIAWEVK